MILAGVGILLFILGVGLSFWKLPSEAAEEAGGVHEEKAGEAKHESTGMNAKAPMAQFASAQIEASGGVEAKAESHEEAVAGHHGPVIYDDISESGTWRRAHWFEDQAIEAHHEREAAGLGAKIGVSWLIGGYVWLAVALFGVFFISVCYTANAGWYLPVKRLLENYYRFIPIGAIIMLIVAFTTGGGVYQWLEPGIAKVDELIQHKSAFLNIGFLIGTGVFLTSLWGLLRAFVEDE